MGDTIGSINSISAQFALKSMSLQRETSAMGLTPNAASFKDLLTGTDNTLSKQELHAAKVKSEFESVVVSQFVGEMLSTSNSKVFGDGVQGDFINSVLTEAISKQIAQSGSLSIGKMV
ncbi:MAG: hypothetical protein AB8B49_10530 [Nitratireductor sp.]